MEFIHPMHLVYGMGTTVATTAKPAPTAKGKMSEKREYVAGFERNMMDFAWQQSENCVNVTV